MEVPLTESAGSRERPGSEARHAAVRDVLRDSASALRSGAGRLVSASALVILVGTAAKAADGERLPWGTAFYSASSRIEAFLRPAEARIWIATETGCQGYSAQWGIGRAGGSSYKVRLAQLTGVDCPRTFPPSQAGWESLKVISPEEWLELSKDVFDSLTPDEPTEALYFQTHLGEGVLYRDDSGQPHRVSLTEVPRGVIVHERATMAAMAADIARESEAWLRRAHPETESFLILPGPGRLPTILDCGESRSIILQPTPNPADPVYRRFGEMSGSVFLESHVYGIMKNPVSSVARLLNTGLQTFGRIFRPILPRRVRELPEVGHNPRMDLDVWETWLDRKTGTRRIEGTMDLLIGGERFFPRFEEAVDSATNQVHVRIGIFDRDDVAVAVADQLKERSQEIKVKVLLDRLSSQISGFTQPMTSMPDGFTQPRAIRSYLQADSKVAVRAHLNPWMSADHAKVLLVDGRLAWVGGMNIGREYRYEWHDLMVELEGPVVAHLEGEFSRNWAHAGALGDLNYLAEIIGGRKARALAGDGPYIPIRVLPTKTLWTPLSTAVFGAVKRARNHIYLENPYLFDRHLTATLAAARQRGVDVRVILPSVNNFIGSESSNLVTANYLHRHGVRVFFYPGMTHVKALLVDGWSCVGSANFNHLSLRLNQEQNVATSDPAFAARLRRELFEVDFARSHEMQDEMEASWTDHLMDAILAGL